MIWMSDSVDELHVKTTMLRLISRASEFIILKMTSRVDVAEDSIIYCIAYNLYALHPSVPLSQTLNYCLS